ncbi:hypothetical protein J437_LFUL011196 [Ladona fulva]|uniref:Uncharacterized protein n=1 Tax=Ladona fulva TaxID=123851 RepID=A0A8K0KM47_LADFU|nr:hypothetical protein J437_LFUL011196 [Ladona fulva]
MEPLRKSLLEFFKQLVKHKDVVSGLLDRSLKPIEKIRNFSEQLFYVKRAEIDDMPIGNIPDIKDNLLYKIRQSIEEEIAVVHQIMAEFKSANTELERFELRALKSLENVGDLTVVEDQEILCDGSASCPSFLQMVEWIQDFCRLYHALYIKFSTAVMAIGEDDCFEKIGEHQMESEELKNLTQTQRVAHDGVNLALGHTSAHATRVAFEGLDPGAILWQPAGPLRCFIPPTNVVTF